MYFQRVNGLAEVLRALREHDGAVPQDDLGPARPARGHLGRASQVTLLLSYKMFQDFFDIQ